MVSKISRRITIFVILFFFLFCMKLEQQIKQFLKDNIDSGLPEIYKEFKVYSRRRLLNTLFTLVSNQEIIFENNIFYLIKENK